MKKFEKAGELIDAGENLINFGFLKEYPEEEYRREVQQMRKKVAKIKSQKNL